MKKKKIEYDKANYIIINDKISQAEDMTKLIAQVTYLCLLLNRKRLIWICDKVLFRQYDVNENELLIIYDGWLNGKELKNVKTKNRIEELVISVNKYMERSGTNE